jgi:hypothetical protein
MLVGVGTAMALLLIGTTHVAYAQSEMPPGRFVAATAGFGIDYPQGWSRGPVNEVQAIFSAAGDEQDAPGATMTVLVVDRLLTKRLMTSDIGIESGRVIMYEDSACKSLLNEIVPLGDTRVFHTIRECSGQDAYSKSETYIILTLTKSVAVSIIATSVEAYETNHGAFTIALETIAVDEPVDYRAALEVILGATNIFTQTMKVESTDTEVRFTAATSSHISRMAFDEKEKRILVTINEERRSEGHLLIPAHQLLVGPYQVHINGEPSEDIIVIGSETAGPRLLIVRYERGVQEIEVTGTQVVPEFGGGLAIVLTASTMAAYFVYRLRRFPETKI